MNSACIRFHMRCTPPPFLSPIRSPSFAWSLNVQGRGTTPCGRSSRSFFGSLLCSSCRSWDRSHHVPRLPPSPTFLLPLSTPSIFPIDPSDLPIGIPRRSPNGLFPWKVAQCPHQTFPIPPIKGSQSTRSTSPSPPRSASRRRWRRAQRVAAACFPLLLRTGPPDIVLECKDAP